MLEKSGLESPDPRPTLESASVNPVDVRYFPRLHRRSLLHNSIHRYKVLKRDRGHRTQDSGGGTADVICSGTWTRCPLRKMFR